MFMDACDKCVHFLFFPFALGQWTISSEDPGPPPVAWRRLSAQESAKLRTLVGRCPAKRHGRGLRCHAPLERSGGDLHPKLVYEAIDK